MSAPVVTGPAAGWFGKIPALGDFATRRLPASFVVPWDEWLSRELAELRALWTDQWSARFRQSPTVCFAIDAGVVDGRAWQGVIVPSCDRVGREFPLTLARSAQSAPHEQDWWAELVATAARAHQSGCGLADFDRAVEEFFAVSPDAVHGLHGGWWRWCDGDWSATPCYASAGLPRGEQFRALLGTPPGV
jgi:type VI secretion system protein ImpM